MPFNTRVISNRSYRLPTANRDALGGYSFNGTYRNPAEYFTGFEDIEQKLIDAGYGDLVGANYWSKLTYKPGILDNLGATFGARTGYDKFYENARMQYGEYLSGLMQQAFANEYNSPLQQGARMREANQNPDLLGTGDVAGAAAPEEDTNNVLPDTPALSPENLQSYSQFLFSLPSMIVGFAKDVRSLKSIGLANEGQSIANDSAELGVLGGLYSRVKEGILSAVDEDDVDLTYVEDDPNNPDVAGAVEKSLHKQLSNARDRFLRIAKESVSPTLYKSLVSASDEYFGSMEFASELAERRSRYFENKVRKSRIRNSKFVGGNNHMFDDVMDSINKGMTAMVDLKNEFEVKSQMWTLRNSAEYQEKFNSLAGPSLTASNDITQSTYQTQSLGLDVELKRLNKKMIEAQEQMVYDLKTLADSGNTWARIGLYLINAFRIAK